MKLKHGHIYLIEFDPSSGHEFKKMRPAVLLSSNALLKRSNLVTCIPLTSNINNIIAGDDLLVKKNSSNNLFADSILKAQHISTFDKRRVRKYIGELDDRTLQDLKVVVRNNFVL